MKQSRVPSELSWTTVHECVPADALYSRSAFVHIASPFHWNVEQPDDFIKPAVAGTVSALKAAHKEPGMKRVIVTSSYASYAAVRITTY